MAKALKQILSNNQAKLKIDLSELFGLKFPNDSSLRQAVGQSIIDKIRERTEGNISADGKKFKSYSQAYADSLAFKAYGKSKGNPNLKQTGDMLGLMDIVEENTNSITIGWQDETEAGKAHGHVTGNVGVKRDFLGLTSKDISELKREWASELRAAESADGNRLVDSVTSAQAFVAGQTISPRTRGFGELLREFLNGEE